jgi:hypothetical protein
MDELITDKDIIIQTGGAAAPVAPVLDYIIPEASGNSRLDETLFQILEAGVNTIVENIKLKLGNNIGSTNGNAINIINALNGIKTQIDAGLQTLGTDGDISTIRIQRNPNGVSEVKQGNGTDVNHSSFHLEDGDELYREKNNMKNWMSQDANGYNNLDFNYYRQGTLNKIDDLPGIKLDNNTPNININNPDHVEKLNNRLANCQLLEMLYMIKHEELMKTFAFTLNLFDKYKYAIKIMLFLLKNLVRKTMPPGAAAPVAPPVGVPPVIRLPKALITNIGKLLKDQAKVQEIITDMQTNLNDNFHLARLSTGNTPGNEPTEDTINDYGLDGVSPYNTHIPGRRGGPVAP